MSSSTNLTHNPDMPAKPCPGLDGTYCGQPRKLPAGYCDEHRRQYQRRRYAVTRKKAGYEYTVRTVARVQQELCDCCEVPAPGDLSEMVGAAGKYVCGQCYRFAQDVIKEFGYGRYRKLVAFSTEHPLAFMPPTATVTENVANPTKFKPGHANELLFKTGKRVTSAEAYEYEYVAAVWARAKRYGFDPDGDDTYEYIDTHFGDDIRSELDIAILKGELTLKTELTEEEAPWLF